MKKIKTCCVGWLKAGEELGKWYMWWSLMRYHLNPNLKNRTHHMKVWVEHIPRRRNVATKIILNKISHLSACDIWASVNPQFNNLFKITLEEGCSKEMSTTINLGKKINMESFKVEVAFIFYDVFFSCCIALFLDHIKLSSKKMCYSRQNSSKIRNIFQEWWEVTEMVLFGIFPGVHPILLKMEGWQNLLPKDMTFKEVLK